LREFIKSKNASEAAKWALEQLLAEWRGGPPRIAIGTRLVVSAGKVGFEVFPGETWLNVNQLFVGPRPPGVADREYDEIYVRNIDGFRFEHLPIDRLKGLLSRNGRLVIDFYERRFAAVSGPMVAKLEDAGIEDVRFDGGYDPGFVSDYRLMGFRPDEPESSDVRSIPWPSSTDHVLVIGGGDRFHAAAEGDVSVDTVPGRLWRMLLQIPNEHFRHISGSLSANDVRPDTLSELHRILTPGGTISLQADADISAAVEAAAIRQGLRDLGFEDIEDFGAKYADHPEGVWGIAARKPSAWTPRATDHTLVVGGGHAYRASQAGEVFLDIYPEARPDILSDIRHASMIPAEHFNRVDFENFDYFALREYDVLRQTPALALSEAFRILKPGGTLTGTTAEVAAFSADDRTLIVRSLEKAGFEDIRMPVSGYPSISAWKPGAGDPRVGGQ
jgi:hypothetical protein